MKAITKNIITREEALKISPEYVAFAEGNWDSFNAVNTQFEKAVKGQEAITFLDDDSNPATFVRGTISAVINDDYRAVDGPLVRFSNGEYTWRVDGDRYAFLFPKDLPACRRAVDAVLAAK